MARGETPPSLEKGIIAAVIDPSGDFVLSAYQPPVDFDRLYKILELDNYSVARIDFADEKCQFVQMVAHRVIAISGEDAVEYHKRQARHLPGYTAVSEVIQMAPREL